MRIIILPPHRLWCPWTTPPDPGEPDREKPFRLLAALGYRHDRIDPYTRPWNPLARAHPLLRAIDPLRALRVLLWERDAGIVLCYFESSALLILLLRRLFLFRGKVAIYDLGIPGGWRMRRAILGLVAPRADLLLPLGANQVAGLLALGARPASVRALRTATCADFYADAGDAPDGYVLAVGDDISRDYPTLLAASVGLSRELRIRSRSVAEDGAAWPQVRVLAGALTSAQYRDLVAGAVLVVLPLHASVHAGGISTLLEAMSSGKPVVVSASPGLADYTRDGENCRVVPAGEPDVLRREIEALLADPAARRRLGAGARRFVEAHCSAEAKAAQLAQAFATVGGPLPA